MEISYRASIITSISSTASWVIFYFLCYLFLTKNVKKLYTFARVGETFIPLGSTILFFPSARMLLTIFYCFEGESEDKLNLHLDCDIPCWQDEHNIYTILCMVTLIAYVIVAS